MTFLLDTHVWLWMITDPSRLGGARDVVEDASTDLVLSAASTWEIAIKYRLGRLPLPAPPASYVPDQIVRTGVTPKPIEHGHAAAVADLPDLHRDPFDRLLVAQAQLDDLTIITADPLVHAYEVTTLGV